MFFVIANNLGLDLMNTRIVDGGKQVDLLNGFDDLLEWSVAVDLIKKPEAVRTKKKWAGTREAEKLFEQAFGLRDSLKQLADDLEHGRTVSAESLNALNDVVRSRSGYFEIQRSQDGYEKRFHSEIDDIGGLLVPVAESVIDLLCYGDLTQIKKCEGETCVLHFYDISKNHRRRWCSMAACGNRAKANAFYRRKTSAA